MMFKVIKIKKSFFLLFLLLTFFVTASVFAEDIIDSAILVLDKQKENYKIYEQGDNYVFEKGELSNSNNNKETVNGKGNTEGMVSNFNEMGVSWYVIFDFSGQTIKVYEQDLDWQWEKNKNGLIGKTEFYGCPAEIDYFYDEDKQLKVKASFTNLTGLPIENLEYRFVAKHSKVLPSESEVSDLIKKVKTGEFSYNGNTEIGSTFSSINQFENKNVLVFRMPVGRLAPDESSQLILNLF